MSNDGEQRKKNPKTQAELESQMLDVTAELGAFIDPEIDGEITKKTVEELRGKFSTRYRVYLETLRDMKTGRYVPPEEKARRAGLIKALNNIHAYLRNHALDEKSRTLREGQLSVFEDLHMYLEQGGTEGYVKLPTGTGKTVIFSEFIEATGLKTLIVVPTTILIGQTEEKLQTFAGGLDIGKIYHEAKEHGHQVTIITYNSFAAGVENLQINPDDYQLLILDEAHRALSEKRSNAVKKFRHHIKIGFTATPRFSDDKQLSDLLESEIHSMNIREAVEGNMLCPFSVYIANTEVDISSVQISYNGDYSEKELAKAINIQSRNQAAVDLYKSEFHGEKAVAYCCGVSHAKNLAMEFQAVGITAAVVHGDQSSAEQKDIMGKYAQGEIMILCNSDILIEGFDEPRASVCLNLRPTNSSIVAEQRGGRVLRLDPKNPKKFAKIVDFIDKNSNRKNLPVSFAQVAEAAYLEGSNKGQAPGKSAAAAHKKEKIDIKGLKVIVDPEEVIRIVRLIEEQKYSKAPAGWHTVSAIAEKVDKANVTIKQTAEKYRSSHPEWFGEFLNERGRVFEHLSPELITKLEVEFHAYEEAPVNWLTVGAIRNLLGYSEGRIAANAEKYRGTHPQWFRKYYDRQKNLREHYSPDLIDAVSRDLAEIKPPEGWISIHKIARTNGIAEATFRKIAAKYVDKFPDDVGIFQEYGKSVGEYYSPRLVELVAVERDEQQMAPPGWLTASQIAAQENGSRHNVLNLAMDYRTDHPEWFHEYYNESRTKYEHFSPELVEIISQKIGTVKVKTAQGETERKKIENPPEGWQTPGPLSKQLQRADSTIKETAGKYRQDHPEWFMLYKTGSGSAAEYYSPELIRILRQVLTTHENAPEGWLTATGVQEGRQKKQFYKIREISDGYRQSHPEWFKQYFNKIRQVEEFYAPELVQIIEKTLDEFDKSLEIPEGWLTSSALVESTGAAQQTIQRAAEKYRTENPGWFKEVVGKKITKTYYSPELCAKLTAEFGKFEKAPGGWMTLNQVMAKSGKTAYYRGQRIAEKYREEHPEWFKVYKPARGAPTEFYSPELCMLVIDELKQP